MTPLQSQFDLNPLCSLHPGLQSPPPPHPRPPHHHPVSSFHHLRRTGKTGPLGRAPPPATAPSLPAPSERWACCRAQPQRGSHVEGRATRHRKSRFRQRDSARHETDVARLHQGLCREKSKRDQILTRCKQFAHNHQGEAPDRPSCEWWQR